MNVRLISGSAPSFRLDSRKSDARRGVIGNPCSAYLIAGSRAFESGRVPKRCSASAHACGVPGTETERIPELGTSFRLRDAKNAGVALLPARPAPLSV